EPREIPSVLADLGRPRTTIDVGPAGIDAVVWATGFRRAYPWLHLPVFDRHGEISRDGGRTPVPGLYVAGMRLQSGRRSTFIDGARCDGLEVADAIDRRAGIRRAA